MRLTDIARRPECHGSLYVKLLAVVEKGNMKCFIEVDISQDGELTFKIKEKGKR